MSDPFTLIFETSTPHASIARVGGGKSVQREFTGDRSHNSALFAPLQELLENALPDRPSLVLVGSGPGSYSGTRVGMAAAHGVAIASGCPLVAVPSILAVEPVTQTGRALAIGDARRGAYWTARIENGACANEPELTDAEGLRQLVAAAIGENFTVFALEDPARFPLPDELRDHVRLEFPDALRLLHAWEQASEAQRKQWSAAMPEPIYLKPPHITPAKRTVGVQQA